jgi:hypothetical protein
MDIPGPPRPVTASANFGNGLAMPAAAVAILSILGPFGTAVVMPLATRVAYWALTCGLIGGGMAFAMWFLRARIGEGLPRWTVIAIAAPVSAVPGVFVVRLSLEFFSPVVLAQVSTPVLFAQVLFLNLTIPLVIAALRGQRSAAPVLGAAVKKHGWG